MRLSLLKIYIVDRMLEPSLLSPETLMFKQMVKTLPCLKAKLSEKERMKAMEARHNVRNEI